MKICVEQKGNYQYAKIPGKSYRDGNKVRKTGVVYLGRVIDLEKGVFYNRDRGVFTYNAATDTYGSADPKYFGSLANDRRKKEKPESVKFIYPDT